MEPASLPRIEGSSSFRRSLISSYSRSLYLARTRLARNRKTSNRNLHRRPNPPPHRGGTSTYKASDVASCRRESGIRQARLGKVPSMIVVERPGMETCTSAWALRLSWMLPSTKNAGPPFPKPNPVPARHCSKATQPPGAHRIRLRRIQRSHRIHCRIRACQTLLHR